MASTLVLADLSVTLRGRTLFRLSETVRAGEVLTIMGPSGVGKSSLLAAISGNLDPAFSMSGSVNLDGQDITGLPAYRRRIGILMQDDLLFPHLSVGQNLAFGLAAKGSRAQRREIIHAALQDIDLAGFYHRDPASLSGGQRVRVALLRTMLSEPEALLLDEPFSKLDQALRQQIRSYVLARAAGLPTILVTHDPGDASGRVVTLTSRSQAA